VGSGWHSFGPSRTGSGASASWRGGAGFNSRFSGSNLGSSSFAGSRFGRSTFGSFSSARFGSNFGGSRFSSFGYRGFGYRGFGYRGFNRFGYGWGRGFWPGYGRSSFFFGTGLGWGWPYWWGGYWGLGWALGWDPWWYNPYWYSPSSYYYPDYPDRAYSSPAPYNNPDAPYDYDAQSSYSIAPTLNSAALHFDFTR
jgi:hypothetical protein